MRASADTRGQTRTHTDSRGAHVDKHVGLEALDVLVVEHQGTVHVGAGAAFVLDADDFLDRTGSCPDQGGILYLNDKNIKGLKPDVFDNMGAVT